MRLSTEYSDDPGPWEGPEAPAASVEASAVAFSGPRLRPRSSWRQGRGQGVTKLGCLVKDMKIRSLEEISLFSLPVKESEIIDFFLGLLKIMPVQKQTCAGQRTRFRAFVAIVDYNGHVDWGVECSKEVATLSIVPVRKGYEGNKIGKPHTVPCKVTGHCGSVLVCLIPAPRGTGIVSAPGPKKLPLMAGIDDCYISARGCTATLGNFSKATFDAISKTYSYLTPDLWKETVFTKSPYQEFTDYLVKTHTRVSVQRTQALAVATTWHFYTREQSEFSLLKKTCKGKERILRYLRDRNCR
uniref:Small ribosomal subunit protein uS5 n=1 Tax=Propithecus coquereli TaxID=379532 RepID=A0A2K6EWA0_PROCO